MGTERKGPRFKASDIDVADFLEALEIQNVTQATEKEFKFSCPFPGHAHGDEKPSAYMNIETSAWMCHGCKRSGNGITFLAEFEEISLMLSTRFLHERYGGAGVDADAFSARVELEKLFESQEKLDDPEADPTLDEDLLDRYLIDWRSVAKSDSIPEWGDYIFDRGFKPKTLNSWDIGYCEEKDRVVIPVRNHEGDLVGFKARSYRDGHQPKYLVLGSGEWDRYHVSLNLFGLYRALAAMPHTGERVLILVEGELNVIAMWQMGYTNVVALNGSSVSDTQKRLLASACDRVIVFLDSDESGDIGTAAVVAALDPIIPVWVVPDHDFDAADAIHPGKAATEDSVRALLDDAESALKIQLASRLETR